MRYVLKSGQRGDTHICEPKGGVQNVSVKNIAGIAPRAGTASRGIMPLSDEEVAALRADLEIVQRERETALRADLERVQQERETALIAELERVRRETEAMQAKLEKAKRELKRSKSERELRKQEYEAWPQSETVDRPISPLLEGPEQSAPTTVAIAAEAPAAEVTTNSRVFPDTAAPDASVERAATKLTSVAGPLSKLSGERRASTGILVPLAVRYNNSSSSSSSSSNNNDTTTTCVVALLRPFHPGKGCQRDTRRGKAVIGLDLPFDRGKA